MGDTVDRLDLVTGDYLPGGYMSKSPDGEWVSYDDYKELKRQLTWIPVSERLPECNAETIECDGIPGSEVVLVKILDGLFRVARYWDDGDWSDAGNSTIFEPPTHWLPIPKGR